MLGRRCEGREEDVQLVQERLTATRRVPPCRAGTGEPTGLLLPARPRHAPGGGAARGSRRALCSAPRCAAPSERLAASTPLAQRHARAAGTIPVRRAASRGCWRRARSPHRHLGGHRGSRGRAPCVRGCACRPAVLRLPGAGASPRGGRPRAGVSQPCWEPRHLRPLCWARLGLCGWTRPGGGALGAVGGSAARRAPGSLCAPQLSGGSGQPSASSGSHGQPGALWHRARRCPFPEVLVAAGRGGDAPLRLPSGGPPAAPRPALGPAPGHGAAGAGPGAAARMLGAGAAPRGQPGAGGEKAPGGPRSGLTVPKGGGYGWGGAFYQGMW